jgi:hypothetical protein
MARLLWNSMCFLLVVFALGYINGFLAAPWPKSQLSDAEIIAGFSLTDEVRDDTAKPCGSLYKNGSKPTKEVLSEILREHSKWVKNKNDGRRANLCNANLQEVDLSKSNLHGANLAGANLAKAILTDADLSNASLNTANLTEARLADTNFSSSALYSTNLNGAFLIRTNFSKANLVLTTLKDTKIFWADFYLTVFEPAPDSLPPTYFLNSAKNLSYMRYVTSPLALQELRDSFRKAGMRQQERAVTYAIKRSERLQMGIVEAKFSWLLFDLTSQYGMSPGNPLRILSALIFVFCIPYMVAIETRGQSGIWAIWPAERIHKESDCEAPTRVTERFFFPNAHGKWWDPGPSTRAFLGGYYFSLLSAFNIGWRDLNVGNWITRMQPHEYVLRGTGWVRFVSGIQSLISVYLVALWFLVYFGRPFE